jgi:hypothetical protein
MSFRVKPSYPRLRRDHPLARDLVVAATADVPELVSGRTWSDHVPSASSFGSAFRGTDAGNIPICRIANPPLRIGSSSITVAGLMRRNAAESTIATTIGWGVESSIANGFAIRVEDGGGRMLYGSGNIRHVPSVIGTGTSDTNWHTVVGCADRDNNKIGLFIDGRFIGDQSFTMTGVADNGPRDLMIGSYGTVFVNQINGLVAIAVVARRLWNPSEVTQFHDDPFAIVRPRQRSYFYAATAEPPPTTFKPYWRQTPQLSTAGVIG